MYDTLQIVLALMLPIILWCPIEQYPGLISSQCPKCEQEIVSSNFFPTAWTDGCSSGNQPRLLYRAVPRLHLVGGQAIRGGGNLRFQLRE